MCLVLLHVTVYFYNFGKMTVSYKKNSLKNKLFSFFLQLLHLGKDYPKGYDYFRAKLKNAFMKNRDLQEPKNIELMIARGNYVVKELEALYMLRKYRTLKKRYSDQ